MISAVRGTLISKTGDRVVLETTGGVSYELAVPLGVLERLPVEGRAVELKTVLVVREDGWALYGFDQELERTVFQRLLGASGIGPRLALALVSTLGGPRGRRPAQCAGGAGGAGTDEPGLRARRCGSRGPRRGVAGWYR
ncbi:MAG: hypothetical protein HYV20_04960 [Gemmatimonadetes bacterium]|nr:hypothetical protein [Gemmatimonadota bacterium]